MNAQQTINSWLMKINPTNAGMVLNMYGQCQLTTSRGENCVLFVPNSTSEEFHLFQDIATLPSPCEERIYEEILKLNLPGDATRGGSLALDTMTRNVVFTYTREIALTDIRTFCAVLENFMDAAQEIKELVQIFMKTPKKSRPRDADHRALLRRTATAVSSTSCGGE